MKIKVCPEIGILMFNCVAVKNRSDLLLCSRVMKQNASQTWKAALRDGKILVMLLYGKYLVGIRLHVTTVNFNLSA